MALRNFFSSIRANVAVISSSSATSLVPSTHSAVQFLRPICLARTLCTSTEVAPYERLSGLCKEVTNFTDLSSLVQWDERVMMPVSPEAAVNRGAQKAALARVVHEKSTSAELKQAIDAAKREIVSRTPSEWATIRDADRNYNLLQGVSMQLVSEIAEQQAVGRQQWAFARSQEDYTIYEPHLADTLELQKLKASAMNSNQHQYDTLLGMFERGMTAERVAEMFDSIKEPLKTLVDKVVNDKLTFDREVPEALTKGWDADKQLELAKIVAEAIGFDAKRGRIDICATPFAAPAGYDDVRMSILVNPDDNFHCLRLAMHEGGHSIYEQGKNRDYQGLPVGQALSIGAHESQSLFYERMVGKTLPFFKWVLPKIHSMFPGTKDVTAEDMYYAANDVKLGSVRAAADELTYPLHIMLRFDLERKMFDEAVDTAELLRDLPAEWRKMSLDLLGVEPEKDSEGCLQDGHWGLNYIGYFPGYLVGAMTAAQLYHHMKTKVYPDIEEMIEIGDFPSITNWLNKEIHEVGSLYESLDDLLIKVTGEKLNPQHFMDYVKEKYSNLYVKQLG